MLYLGVMCVSILLESGYFLSDASVSGAGLEGVIDFFLFNMKLI